MTDKNIFPKKVNSDSDSYLKLARYIIHGHEAEHSPDVDQQPIIEVATPYGIVTGPQSAIDYIRELIEDDVSNALKYSG